MFLLGGCIQHRLGAIRFLVDVHEGAYMYKVKLTLKTTTAWKTSFIQVSFETPVESHVAIVRRAFLFISSCIAGLRAGGDDFHSMLGATMLLMKLSLNNKSERVFMLRCIYMFNMQWMH